MILDVGGGQNGSRLHIVRAPSEGPCAPQNSKGEEGQGQQGKQAQQRFGAVVLRLGIHDWPGLHVGRGRIGNARGVDGDCGVGIGLEGHCPSYPLLGHVAWACLHVSFLRAVAVSGFVPVVVLLGVHSFVLLGDHIHNWGHKVARVCLSDWGVLVGHVRAANNSIATVPMLLTYVRDTARNAVTAGVVANSLVNHRISI